MDFSPLVLNNLNMGNKPFTSYFTSPKVLMVAVLLSAASPSKAQQEPEYLMEVGIGLGMTNYLGDFNGSITKAHQPSATFVLRRLFNPYTGLRLGITYGKLKGSSKDVDTYYPDLQLTPYKFDNKLIDGSVVFEYNFWPYGTGKEYRGAKRLTPFIMGGLGLTYAKTADDNVFTGNLPIGLGIKYKLSQRINLAVEWKTHFTLSDKLDGKEDPYGIVSSGAFKNTDAYSGLQVTLTYSFMTKCKTCHNDDD